MVTEDDLQLDSAVGATAERELYTNGEGENTCHETAHGSVRSTS